MLNFVAMIRKLAKITSDDIGVFAISLVDKPANKAQFRNPCDSGLCSLSENNEVVGLILRPEQDIYRISEDGEEFNMYFDAEQVKLAQESFAKNLALKNSNLQHSDEQQDGVTFTESWIVEDTENDKAIHYGFTPKLGEWYVKAKIENDEVLEALKTEQVKGFSLEGEFTLTADQRGEQNFNHMNILEKLKALLAEAEEAPTQEVKAEEEKAEEVKTASIEEVAAIVEKLVEQVSALTPKAPSEEEMAVEKAKEQELADLKKSNEELSEKLTKLSEQVAQIPVDAPEKREPIQLSEADKLASMTLAQQIEYNRNKSLKNN